MSAEDVPLWRKQRVLEAGMTFTGNLLFPKLSHRLRWRTRLGTLGSVLNIAGAVAFAVLFRWRLDGWLQEQRALKAEVRERLGREPTAEDLERHLRAQRDL